MRLWSQTTGRLMVLTLFLLGSAASAASAQNVLTRPWTDRGYFNVNFTQQGVDRSVEIADTFPLYDETATFGSRVDVGFARVTDVMAGVRLWRNLAVGVGYGAYKDPTSATVTASVPDPLFFDRPHASTTVRPDQAHTEKTVYLSALWTVVLHDNVNVAVFFGPSFTSLDKDLVSGMTVAPGTSDISSFATTRISERVTTGHIGVDIRYTIDVADVPGIRKASAVVRKLGIGIFARYSGGSVDSAIAGGKIEVGGSRYGIGLRIGF